MIESETESPGRETEPDDERLKELIRLRLKKDRISETIRIFHDTSNFFAIDYNDVLILEGKPFLIRNTEKEGRFGIDEEPKFWVRRAIELETGKTVIIKMVFRESYEARIGGVVFQCVRSPRKEARILDLVKGHPSFMQGYAALDEKGNTVRILDYIRGESLGDHIMKSGEGHEDYYYNHFPEVLEQYIGLIRAIRFLHDNGEKHGDIRRDHAIFDRKTGNYSWIDFDFNFIHNERKYAYDLFGLGNVLIYIAGRGDVIHQDLMKNNFHGLSSLNADDFNIVFPNRLANLRRLYPYIPELLNTVMMHFSRGSRLFYENTEQLLEDLEEYRSTI